MEVVVGVLVVLAFSAIAARFAAVDGSGRLRLPGIVDDSIGMWVLRRVTGRPLGRGPELAPSTDPFAAFRRPSTVLAARAAAPGRAGPVHRVSAPAAPALSTTIMGPSWSVVERRARTGRQFGASILPDGRAERAPAGPRLALRLAWLTLAVAAGLIVGGALALLTR